MTKKRKNGILLQSRMITRDRCVDSITAHFECKLCVCCVVVVVVVVAARVEAVFTSYTVL